MKARSTVLGREPANQSTRVIKMRSMLVLLSADDIVKPPIRSMIVGENMMENTYLHANKYGSSLLKIGSLTWSRLESRAVPPHLGSGSRAGKRVTKVRTWT